MSELMRVRLWPLPDAHDFEGSAYELRRMMVGLILPDIDPDLEEIDKEHTWFNLGLKLLDRTREIMAEAADPVSNFHRLHLNKHI